nr:hypothetical protein [uncultured Draconibacterium sp.]
MKQLFKFLILLVFLTHQMDVKSQDIFSRIYLISNQDQIQFNIPNENRYWIMSKPSHNYAFALYSPDDGNWFTHWKTGSGDMVMNRGSLGINISPNAKLHVGSNENDGIFIGKPNDDFGLDGVSYSIKFYGYRDIISNVTSAKISAERTNVCCNWLYQGTDLVFYTTNAITTANSDNSIERMRIKDNGNIGIGTDLSSNPNNYKLAVNGTIGAKEIKVETTSWPDYIFDDNYKLSSIQEVENYINEENHLPGIPSSKEVEDQGISLGEMDAKLLRKIEELTLYLIEQNKLNQILQKRVNQLEKEMSTLRTQ